MKIPLPSFTRIDTFSRCPRQYAHDVIAGPTPSTKAMERGSHVHKCLEVAAKLMLEHGWSWDAAISAVVKAAPEGVLGQPEIESYLERALPVVEELVPGESGVEMWFDAVANLPIRGKIDLISEKSLLTSEQGRPWAVVDEPCVVDFKTISGPHRVKNTYEARRSMQLKIYCLATGLRRAGFIYFPPKTEARAAFVKFKEEDLAAATRWLEMQLDAMLDGWSSFFDNAGVNWGMEFSEEQVEAGYWQAWPLSHPDNMLCSPKWCGHYSNCIGAKCAERP